jgi:hypothetical protein
MKTMAVLSAVCATSCLMLGANLMVNAQSAGDARAGLLACFLGLGCLCVLAAALRRIAAR